MATTIYRLPTALASLSFSTHKNHHCKFFKSISISELNPPSIRVYSHRLPSNTVLFRVSSTRRNKFIAFRSKFSRAEAVVSRGVFKVRGLVDDDSATGPEPESDNSEAVCEFDYSFFL